MARIVGWCIVIILSVVSRLSHWEECSFSIMLCCNAVWYGLPSWCSKYILIITPAYLITVVSHTDICLVYHYSIQMSHHNSKFKGYQNLNKFSLLDDTPVALLYTDTFMCLCSWHTSTAHTHTATSTHSEIMSLSTSVSDRKHSQSLALQEIAVGWWFHQFQSQADVPEKEVWTWNVSEYRYSFWRACS